MQVPGQGDNQLVGIVPHRLRWFKIFFMLASLSGKLPAGMITRYRHFRIVPVLALAALLSGCQSAFGPQALERTHPAYNEAIISSINEQMLLNLVRMRYRDVPFFLEIGSVTASLSLGANVGVNADVNLGGGDTLSPSAGIAYADKPTISFTPLQGENLLKSILSPLQLEDILVLTQSGWNIDRVFGLCFERINNLYNAPNASGPTPELEPVHKKFGELTNALRVLQENQLIEIGSKKKQDCIKEKKICTKKKFTCTGEERDCTGETEVCTEEKRSCTDIIVKLTSRDDRYKNAFDLIYKLLELDHNKDEFSLSTDFLKLDDAQWTVRTRSISGLLYYLSHNVEAPASHHNEFVTITRTEDGRRFNWVDTPAGSVFQVKSSKDRPEGAYIATRYRGHWFYIEEKDKDSKSTFMLLRQLFDLQAGQRQSTGPTLTLPVR